MCFGGSGGSRNLRAAAAARGGVQQRSVAREYTTTATEKKFRAGIAHGKKQNVQLPGQGIPRPNGPKINYDRDPMFGGRPVSMQEYLGRDRTPATIVNGKLRLGTGSGKRMYGEAKPLYGDDLTGRYYTQARQQVNNEAELKAFRAAHGSSGGRDDKAFWQTSTTTKKNRHAQNRVAIVDESQIRKKTRNARSEVANTNVDSRRKAKRGTSLRIRGSNGVNTTTGSSGVFFNS